jgi:transposase
MDAVGVVAYQIYHGSVNGQRFAEFVSKIPSGRTLILDNASIHKTKLVRSACEDREIRLVFTPPYSPWYNPVEFAFSKIKSVYRKTRLMDGEYLTDIRTAVEALAGTRGLFAHARSVWAVDRGPSEGT